MTQPIKKILILVAMLDEALPIINQLKLEPKSQLRDGDLPFRYFGQVTESFEILLIQSGTDDRYSVDNIGTQAATLMAYVGIDFFKPDLVISAGTAGGFAARGASIGTVYLSDEEFIFHDRMVPLPGFDEQGVGHYPAANVRGLAHYLNLPLGKISSGSSFKKDADQMNILLKSGAVAKEMEAAAVAWVCWIKNTPCIAVKSITNLLDQPQSSEDQFVENFSLATNQLAANLNSILLAMQGKGLKDL